VFAVALWQMSSVVAGHEPHISARQAATRAINGETREAGQATAPTLFASGALQEGAKGDHQPVVRNVQLDNVTSSASPRVLYIRGVEGAVIDGIRISNCTFNGCD